MQVDPFGVKFCNAWQGNGLPKSEERPANGIIQVEDGGAAINGDAVECTSVLGDQDP